MCTELGLARHDLGMLKASIGARQVGGTPGQGMAFGQPGSEGCTRGSTSRLATIEFVWSHFGALGDGMGEPGRG